jgi:Uma2 family endonuclease
MAVKTHRQSIRYPDVAVYCGEGGNPGDGELKAFEKPAVIFEILSAGTARTDLGVKLEEYKALPSVSTIVFVDVTRERVRIIQRSEAGGWNDLPATEPMDVPLPSIDIVVPHAEMFADD